MNILGLSTSQWVDVGISLAIVVAMLIIGRWVARIILGRLVRRLARGTSTELDDAILDAVRTPLYWLAVILAAQFAVARLQFLPERWDPAIKDVFFVLFMIVGFSSVWRLVVVVFTWYGKTLDRRSEQPLSPHLLPFFRRVTLIILGAILIITLLSHFNVNVSALVTTLGIGSLAVALAAQAALEDTVNGFTVMVDQPYRVGDRIEILDLNTWGDVVDIGLRSTRIRTRDNRTVIVPNSILGKSLVVNHSYPDPVYRIEVHVGIAYGTDIEFARQTMIDAVRGADQVMPDKPVEALFLEFGDSALIFRVRWWIESYVDTRRIFDKVNTAIYYSLNQAGIEIPFPQRDIWHRVSPSDTETIGGMLGRQPGS